MKKLLLLLLAIVAMGGIANAIIIDVEVGDRPYYLHGGGYWVGRTYYVWVPGHWGPHHRHWIHGHYAPR